MNSSRSLGIGLFIFGALFVLINTISISVSDTYFPKLLCVGIVICFVGLGFVFFPGPNIDIKEYNGSTYLKKIWKDSAIKEKIAWLLFLAIGVIITFIVFNYFHLELA